MIRILALILATTAAAAQAQQPAQMTDDSRITLYGTVEEIENNRFTLNYGEGTVQVETGEILRGRDVQLRPGDHVTVFGAIDDDLQEKRTVKAGGIYVERAGALLHAGALDGDSYFNFAGLDEEMDTVIQGTVRQIKQETFTLATGDRELTVDVGGMGYNPLQAEGGPSISEGDIVNVTGNMENEFFEDQRIFDADTVVTVRNVTQ